MRLTNKQWYVLDIIARGDDPYSGVALDRNAFIGRSNTIHSLSNRGLLEREHTPRRKWQLTDSGKEVLAQCQTRS